MNDDIIIQKENEFVSKNNRRSFEEEPSFDEQHITKISEFSEMYSKNSLNFINQIVEIMYNCREVQFLEYNSRVF